MEAHAQLNDLRQKVLNGEEVSPEEYERVISAIREARRAGAPRLKKERKNTQREVGQDILDSLFTDEI